MRWWLGSFPAVIEQARYVFFALPLGVNYRTRRIPVITFALIGINLLVYLLTLALSFKDGKDAQEWIQQTLWLIPAKSNWHTYLTSFFVHDGFSQLAGNMIYLFLFGTCVEDTLGRSRSCFSMWRSG